MLFSDGDFALCCRVVPDDFPNGGDGDVSGVGVFDADDRGCDGGLHVGALKAQVGVYHLAVNEPQIFAVAQGLGADDPAVVQGKAVGIPGQVLSLYGAVAHGDILPMPESVLGVKDTVFKEGVLYVLKGILPRKADIAEDNILRTHHEILADGGGILHADTPCGPAELRGNNVAVFYGHIGALPQSLDAVHFCSRDGDVPRVPQGGPAIGGHFSVFDDKVIVMPEGVAQVIKAVLRPYVGALLKGAFPVRGAVESAVPHGKIVASVKGPLLVKGLIFNDFHRILL